MIYSSTDNNSNENKMCNNDLDGFHCFQSCKKNNKNELSSFCVEFGRTVSYSFDVCRARNGQMENVVDRILRMASLVISVPDDVSQLLFQPV